MALGFSRVRLKATRQWTERSNAKGKVMSQPGFYTQKRNCQICKGTKYLFHGSSLRKPFGDTLPQMSLPRKRETWGLRNKETNRRKGNNENPRVELKWVLRKPALQSLESSRMMEENGRLEGKKIKYDGWIPSVLERLVWASLWCTEN